MALNLKIFFNSLIFLTFFLTQKTWASNNSTNGYFFSIVKPQPITNSCSNIFSPTEASSTDPQIKDIILKVLKDWHSRGDYSDASLEKLMNFELKLDPAWTTWFVFESPTKHAAIRMYDGTETQLPMERKFPQENFRNNPKQPLLELGLLDVVVGIENGPQALFHRVASYLKDHYLDPVTKIGIFDAETTPKIIITSRGANARLYTSQYGFDFTLENNNRKKTADGMYVLEISIAKFVHLFYGKRLYPATKGETDFWLSFFNNYKSKIDNAKSYAASVYSHIVSLQRPDFWMTAKPQLDPRVNTESLYSQWMNEIAQMDKLLIEEDILNLDVKLRKLRRSIWNWEPIQVNVTEVPVQMGSGFFSWNYTVQHTSWDFRNRTHLGFNSDDW